MFGLRPLKRVRRLLRAASMQEADAPVHTIVLNGRTIPALPGQSVAAALIGVGVRRFQEHPISGEPRGPYCGMGVCFDCEVTIDGLSGRRACLTTVRDGMVIRTDRPQDGEQR